MKIYEFEYIFFKKFRELKGYYMRARIKGKITPQKVFRSLGIFLVFLVIFFSSPVTTSIKPGSTESGERNYSQEIKAQSEQEKDSTTSETLSDYSEPSKLVDSPSIPDITSEAVLVMDTKSNSILYKRNSDVPLPPASLTKVMTALMSIDSFSLEEEVPVPAECIDLDGNNMGLFAGEVLSVRDVLYGVLLLSASDAACTLANYKTTMEEFIAAMNIKAKSLGLKDTTYKNVIGLDQEGHLSSARDLAKLAGIAMEREVFRSYVATAEINVAGRHLKNTNKLLGKVSGVTGVKTGYTENAKECLIVSAQRGGNEILIVLLGSDDRFADAEKLLDWIFRVYKWER